MRTQSLSVARRTCIAVAVLASLVQACGGSFFGGSGSKTQCPGSQTTCLTAPTCAWDEGRACELCHCSAPVAPEDYTPQGPPRMSGQ